MKDYYDLYFFVNYRWNTIDKEILTKAIIKTFSVRNSITDLKNFNKTLEMIKGNEFLNKLWSDYSKKYDYSKQVSFLDTIEAIAVIKNMLYTNATIRKEIAQYK